MIGLENINPDNIILSGEKYHLYALSYLLQLTEKDTTQEQKAELIWILTRQLLVAEHNFHQGNQISDNIIQEKLTLIKKNEIIERLLSSSVVSEEIVKEIIEIEELYLKWYINLKCDLEEQYSQNENSLKEFYDNNEGFTQKDAFEVYQIKTSASLPEDATSIQEIKKLISENDSVFLVGMMSKKEINEKLEIPEKYIQLYKVIRHGSSYYYISDYLEEYKAPFLKVKPDLIRFIVEQELENNIEEYSLQLLDNTPINYNQTVLETIM